MEISSRVQKVQTDWKAETQRHHEGSGGVPGQQTGDVTSVMPCSTPTPRPLLRGSKSSQNQASCTAIDPPYCNIYFSLPGAINLLLLNVN